MQQDRDGGVAKNGVGQHRSTGERKERDENGLAKVHLDDNGKMCMATMTTRTLAGMLGDEVSDRQN